MSNKTVVYNRKKYKTADIADFHNEGYDVLCSVCKAKLIFILSLEEAKIKDPGILASFAPIAQTMCIQHLIWVVESFGNDLKKELKSEPSQIL